MLTTAAHRGSLVKRGIAMQHRSFAPCVRLVRRFSCPVPMGYFARCSPPVCPRQAFKRRRRKAYLANLQNEHSALKESPEKNKRRRRPSFSSQDKRPVNGCPIPRGVDLSS
eukprot:6211748-Pleurochrysis_carterae.AAC.3